MKKLKIVKILALSLYGSIAASHRYRFLQYKKTLKSNGVRMEINSIMTDKYLKFRFYGSFFPFFDLFRSFLKRAYILFFKKKNYDLVIIHCELFPYIPFCIEKFFLPKLFIYDFDDAFHIKYQNNFFLKNKINKIISLSKGVTAGNNFLKNYASSINPNTIMLPTAINTKTYFSIKKKKNSIFTIGWIGSPSTQIYLRETVIAISEFAKEIDIEFTVIGANAPNIPNVKKINVIKWNKNNYLNEIAKFDIGIMPLFDNEWAKGKCAFKLIQYMALGIPAVASNVGANKDLLNKKKGFLVSNKNQWVNAFKKIKQEKKLVNKMTLKSKKYIEQNYSTKANIKKMLKLYFNILNNKIYE